MKRKQHTFLAIIALLCFHSFALHAQLGWRWATGSYATSPAVEFNDMATDPFGNVYEVGTSMGGTSTFGPFIIADSFSTGQQGVIVCMDSNGAYRWALATQHDATYFLNLATDPYGNAYVTGSGGAYTRIGGKVCGNDAPFCIKIDAAGNVKWIHTIGSNPGTVIRAITVSKTGYLYIAGTFTTSSGCNVFYTKYDSSFHTVWSNSYGGVYSDYVSAACVTEDSFLYLGGVYTSPIIHLGPDILTTCGSLPYYVAKFNASGGPVWARQIDGRSYSSTQLNSIATDKNDNVYLSGGYDTAFVFGSDTLPVGITGMFLARYDSSGNPKWARTLPAMHISYKVASDACGNLWTCGGPGYPTIPGDDSMMAAEYDTSGILENTIALSIGGDDINGVALDNKGNVYIGSDYAGTPAIGGHALTSAPTETLFTAKCKYEIGPCTRDTLFVLQTNETAKPLLGQIRLFPNPASETCTISDLQGFPDGSILEISDVSGRTLKRLPVSGYECAILLDCFSSGLYLYHLYSPGGGYVTGKLAVIK